MNYNLESLEETLLLILITEKGYSYGHTVSEVYKKLIGRNISINAVHSIFNRLESRGLVKSKLEPEWKKKGGKRRMMCKITPHGIRVILKMKEDRIKLWDILPPLDNYKMS